MHQRIFVAGHHSMVGSAIVRQLLAGSYAPEDIVRAPHATLDLTDQATGQVFFESEKFIQVYLAAEKVGDIRANNNFTANFIYQHLLIHANVINAAVQQRRIATAVSSSNCIDHRYL